MAFVAVSGPVDAAGVRRMHAQLLLPALPPRLNKKSYGWKSLGSNVNGVTAVIVIRSLPE